jgi:hypothetical protein
MMKRTITLLILIILLLWAGSALAMSSTNYRLDWFTPMAGGGGGPASSTNYAATFTVGQTVVGASTSEHYGSGLGYWYGLLSSIIRNFLPLVTKQ